MSNKKIITVIGATGAQGGGLVRAMLADPAGPFVPRAVTRKLDSEKARALIALGAEVVAADSDDPQSLERAFAGAHGVFCVTNFWEHFSPEREGTQAAAMARATRKAGVEHVVWSTLEDTRKWVPLDDGRLPTLQGKYKVPHFDAKGAADKIFAEEAAPTSYLLASFYWENFIHFGMGPRPGADGELVLALPLGGVKLPGIAAADIGKCAYGVFRRGGELIGKTVSIAGDHPTCAQMAASLTKALGEEVRYNEVPPDVYRSFGFPGADDLGNMFQVMRDFEPEFSAPRDLTASRVPTPGLKPLDDGLAENGSRIPLG